MVTIVCDECSCEVPTGSELCPECGFPVSHVEPELCPECQNLVFFADGVCPECGFPKEDPPPKEGAQEVPVTQSEASGAEAAAAGAPPSPPPAAPVTADPGRDAGAEELLRVQIAVLNDLKEQVGKLAEGGTETGNNEMLNDLITSISNFVSSSEKIKNDMVVEMREQTETTLQSVREVASSFAGEMRTAAEGIKEAQKAALAEVHSAAQQAKAASGNEGSPGGEKIDYLLYICGALLLFTVLNVLVTAYVARMVK